jgi:tripartite-type tricarboxylate transporter receptor subunit TctC
VNSTDIEYPKKARAALGKVPNAKTLGLRPFTPPRFIAMHPDTPDDQVAAMSRKLGEMLESKPVKDLIGKLNEDIVFIGHDKAAGAYADALADSRKYLPLFK